MSIISTERLQELSACLDPGPYLRGLAAEVLALRADAARLAWLENYRADINFIAGRGWRVIGRYIDGVVYGIGPTLSAAIDDAMRKTK